MLASTPCTWWTQWLRVNRPKGDAEFHDMVALRQAEGRKLVQHFEELAEILVQLGGSVSFDRPKGCIGWNQRYVQDALDRLGLMPARVDGCAVSVQETQVRTFTNLG